MIFKRILKEAAEAGFLDTSAVFFDGTHIKASANNKNFVDAEIQEKSKDYQEALELEINGQREAAGKKPLTFDKKTKTKHIKQSTVDPESGRFHKGEHKIVFAHSAMTVCEKHNFVLDFDLNPGNVHDSQSFLPVYERVKQVLHFSTITSNGYRTYKSDPKICVNCPFLAQCTTNKKQIKQLQRHVWQGYMDWANHIRWTDFGKKTYKLRCETIERVFGDAKEKHGMRYTQYRGHEKVRLQVLLTFACMNLKKMATWKWRNKQLLFEKFLIFFLKFKKQIKSEISNLKFRFCLQSEVDERLFLIFV